MSEELKPFQKVLVRQSPNAMWEACFFGRKSKATSPYYCLGVFYRYCIPYEGNEHLLGTKNSPKQEFKFGDHVEVRDSVDESWREAIYMYYRKNAPFPYVVIRDGNDAATSYGYCRHAKW